MNKIMACIDGSAHSSIVCDYALWASNKMNASIQLLHVLDKGQYPQKQNLSGNIGPGSKQQLLDELIKLDEQRYKIAQQQGNLILNEAQRYVLAKNTGHSVQIRQRYGNLAETLVELETEYQLLILGKQGEQTQSAQQHIGSQLETIIRTVEKSIFITPSYYIQPQAVMLAFDGSIHSEKCLSALTNNPLLRSLSVHLVTVGLNIADKLSNAKVQLENHNIIAHTAVLSGNIEIALNHYQQQHDISLLLMGAYGHTRIRQFFVGSTTTTMLQHAQIPILIIK